MARQRDRATFAACAVRLQSALKLLVRHKAARAPSTSGNLEARGEAKPSRQTDQFERVLSLGQRSAVVRNIVAHDEHVAHPNERAVATYHRRRRIHVDESRVDTQYDCVEKCAHRVLVGLLQRA